MSALEELRLRFKPVAQIQFWSAPSRWWAGDWEGPHLVRLPGVGQDGLDLQSAGTTADRLFYGGSVEDAAQKALSALSTQH